MHAQGHLWHSTTSLGWTFAESSNSYDDSDDTGQTWAKLCADHEALGCMVQQAARAVNPKLERAVKRYIAEEQNIV